VIACDKSNYDVGAVQRSPSSMFEMELPLLLISRWLRRVALNLAELVGFQNSQISFGAMSCSDDPDFLALCREPKY